MRLLAIETATDACSCALWLDGDCREEFRVAPRRHGELILDMAARLLSHSGMTIAQLDGLAVGRGPGSFTGVRIATGVVQGLAYAAGLAVAPVSSLQAVAQRVHRTRHVCRALVAFDARMGEVYWGAYATEPGGRMEAAMPELVCSPREVPIPEGEEWLGVGQGWSSYGALLTTRLGCRVRGVEVEHYPHAEEVALLGEAVFAAGQAVPPAAVVPAYLREQVAVKRRVPH